MEEILSSIKRIIAEDSQATLAQPRGKRTVARVEPRHDDTRRDEDDAEEVLELTEAVTSDTQPAETPASAPAPVAELKPSLVSTAAAEASRSSLAALSALVVKPEVVGSDTLEGLVREMLKPMLAEWLDQRLPDVVERLVAQEIQRITARG